MSAASARALYDPARHQPLRAGPWSAARVEGEILDIVRDFESALGPDGCWPSHPLDHADRRPYFAAYAGAAGAVVSLRILRAAGLPAPDLSPLLPDVHAAWLARPDYGYETGLQLGEIGILAPAMLARPEDEALRERLLDCMTRTTDHPAREITSGATGMMHAALTLYRATGEPVWKERFQAGAESLWKSWAPRTGTGEWLWRNEIFGSVRGYYGACHGVAGNAQALLRGADLLPDGHADQVIDRAAATLASGALDDGRDLNWPVSPDPTGTRRLIQWCHGAAGVVAALAPSPRRGATGSALLDELLASAGELVWKAGPLAKGPGLCHGTAGNGYAFLGLFLRTGREEWLGRARTFAMHAIGQRRRMHERVGQGRYTLWTGDGGLAVYLHHCLNPEQTAFPGLELL